MARRMVICLLAPHQESEARLSFPLDGDHSTSGFHEYTGRVLDDDAASPRRETGVSPSGHRRRGTTVRDQHCVRDQRRSWSRDTPGRQADSGRKVDELGAVTTAAHPRLPQRGAGCCRLGGEATLGRWGAHEIGLAVACHIASIDLRTQLSRCAVIHDQVTLASTMQCTALTVHVN
jgi:hypothetical protein